MSSGFSKGTARAILSSDSAGSRLAQDDYYKDEATLAMAYAEAVNEELRELEPIVDVLQLDEPSLQAQPDRARAYAVPAIDRALAGLEKPTCVHLCFGYAFAHARAGTAKPSGYSFLPELDRCAAQQVSIEAALRHLPAERLVAAPDCGMKYLTRPVAFAKLRALAAGAARL
jgi:5-methyltetrahydropteroyltriglutamate--homocysteine methyltransferase